MVYRFGLLLLSLTLTLPAQTARRPSAARRPTATSKQQQQPAPAPNAQAWPIGKLEVEGNKLYNDEKILAIAGLKIGEMAGKKEFDAARDRLLATGAFETVGYRFDPMPGGKANAGTIQVTEITQLYPYRFEELRTDEAALRAHLKSKELLFTDKIPPTQPILDRMTKEIEAFTKINGVVAKIEGAENLSVVFRPGTLPSVAEITFRGNKAIPTASLQEAVSGAGIGAVFTDNRFRQILEASVRPVYEAQGYLDVQFPKFDVTPANNVNGIAVAVHVNEGDVYKLASVDFKGELEEVNTKELMKVGGFETDTVANFDKIRSGVEDIRKALRRNGFIEASTSHDRKLDKEKKTVAVTITLVPNAQFTMGDLRIEGLDIETEPHIRKMWGIKKGSPFNVEYPDHFLDEVRNVLESLGRTRSTVTPNPARQTVDVTLQFEGEKPAKKPPTP